MLTLQHYNITTTVKNIILSSGGYTRVYPKKRRKFLTTTMKKSKIKNPSSQFNLHNTYVEQSEKENTKYKRAKIIHKSWKGLSTSRQEQSLKLQGFRLSRNEKIIIEEKEKGVLCSSIEVVELVRRWEIVSDYFV